MLCLIYHFKASHNVNGDFRPASYKVLHFFHEQGFLEGAFMKEMSKAIPDADHSQLNFLNLDDLKSFALRVGQEMEQEEVRLISAQDYNIGLDGARDLASLRAVFEKYGEVLVIEGTSKKKGFFGKFF